MLIKKVLSWVMQVYLEQHLITNLVSTKNENIESSIFCGLVNVKEGGFGPFHKKRF